MHILNIAGYRFVSLDNIEILRETLLEQCKKHALKGTILLSREGINISLAGTTENIHSIIQILNHDERLADIRFHMTHSAFQPFKRLKVKLKKEIITMRKPQANPIELRAPSISPEAFKQWLDEKKDITILDTRNDYEVRFGTFAGAVNLKIDDFVQFPSASTAIGKNKPIVMFCTGGIRCEKAALYMLSEGYADVYQLDGGILGYFNKVGGAHYQGECFVFDERVSVDPNLEHKGTVQCRACLGPVTASETQLPTYVPGVSCPSCAG
jgi:UPF0176 protein